MIKKTIDTVKNNVWKTITIAITILTLVGGVWGIEDRYANKDVTKLAMNNLQTQQENLQKQQQSFQTQQELSIRERQIEIIRAKLEFYNTIKDDLTKEINDAKRWHDSNPEDIILMERIKELEKSKDRVQSRIDRLMEQLSEVD